MQGFGSRVLIVDDDGATTDTFARILTLEGYEVRTARDAESGLRENDSWQPDAIVLDLRMPFINGLGFLYRLRSRRDHSSTPVVIVTGDQCLEEATIAEIGSLGAEVHFKPLWLDELVSLVRKLLGGNQGAAAPAWQPSDTPGNVH
jgi:two-component system, OmpR family, response regulator